VKAAIAIRQTATTETAPNTYSVPTCEASAPNGAPSNSPTTAAEMTVPSSTPRRSSGALITTQLIAPAQSIEPEAPCRNRLTSSQPIVSASPNERLERPIPVSPASMVRRGPIRAEMMPPGIAKTRVPAA